MRFLPLLFLSFFSSLLLSPSLCFASVSSTPTAIAIDWGSDWLRIVNVNRSPSSIGSHFDMVINEQSNRKTPASAGFDNDNDRVLGEAALSAFYKYPNKIINQLKRLVGANIESNEFKSYSSDFAWAGQQWTTGPYGDVSLLYSSPSDSVSVNELSAMLLQQCARLSEAHTAFQKTSGSVIPKVEDAVIVVPSHFTPSQRALIKEIARAAGISIHELINELSAAAIDYGVRQLYNTSSSTPSYTIFYNIGASSTSASLVEYRRVDNKFIIKILHSADDSSLGSFEFDKIIRSLLIEKFLSQKKKPSGNIEKNGRAMAKLLRESKNIKEQLSAGGLGSVHIEELFEGLDLNTQIKQEELNSKVESLIKKYLTPLKSVIDYSKTLNNNEGVSIDFIELFGGGVRSPLIQNLIKSDYPDLLIGKHLDGDEAAAFGAAILLGNKMELSASAAIPNIELIDPQSIVGEATINYDQLKERLSLFDEASNKKKQFESARNALESYMNEVNEVLSHPDGKENTEKNNLMEGLSTVAAFMDTINKNTTPEEIVSQLESLKQLTTSYRSTIKPKKVKKDSEEEGSGRGRVKRASNRDKAYAREQLKKEQDKNKEKVKKEQEKNNKKNQNQKKGGKNKEDL